MTEEHRHERKNEVSILASMTEMKITLALLLKGQDDTNIHLTQLNGKVVAHENRLNDQTLINQKYLESISQICEKLATTEKEREKTSDWKMGIIDKAGWGVLVGALYLAYKVLVSVGIISNFLNK